MSKQEWQVSNKKDRGWTWQTKGRYRVYTKYLNGMASKMHIYRQAGLNPPQYFVGGNGRVMDGPFDSFDAAEGHWTILQ